MAWGMPGQLGQQVQGIMTREPGSEAVGGHEDIGSFSSKERPIEAVILGTNACSPGFKSLLLEAYLADRACEISHGNTMRWQFLCVLITLGHTGDGNFSGPGRKLLVDPSLLETPVTTLVPRWLCWHTPLSFHYVGWFYHNTNSKDERVQQGLTEE